MTMSAKKRMRDFQRCLRSIQSFSGNQATITTWDEDHLNWVEVLVKPSGGYYEGGTFEFKIYFEDNYPKSPPRVDCLTPIYHPNIDSTCADYNICLNLFDEWQESFNLEDIIQGLLFLLYNPNTEDPLSPYFDGEMSDESLLENIKLSLEGGSVDGVTEVFPENSRTENFREDELTKGIDQILEKACQWVAAEGDDEEEDDDDVVDDDDEEEEEDEKDDDEEENTQEKLDERENNNNLEACTEEGAAASTSSLIMRVESKIDKCEMTGAVAEDCDIVYGAQTAKILWRCLPTWSDVLVTVARTCVDVGVGR